MSDLISRSALLESLMYCQELGRRSLEAIVKAVNNQPTVSEQEIQNMAIEDYKTKLIDRYEHSKSIDEKFACLDLDDVTQIAEQMKALA